jgi:hypothetical protein
MLSYQRLLVKEDDRPRDAHRWYQCHQLVHVTLDVL